MFLAQDQSALLLLPFSSYLYEMIWSLLGETKIIFIPIIIVIVSETLSARAQGLDEGSPAVLSIKFVERKCWWFLAVLMLFLLPGPATNLQVNSYSCGGEGRGSVVDSSTSYFSTANPNTTVKYPIMFGAINNVAVAGFEALSGKLYCGAEYQLQAEKAKKAFVIKDAQRRKEVDVFREQCYLPAIKAYTSASREGKLIESFKNGDVRDNYFFGWNSLSLYNGTHRTDGIGSPIFASILKSFWSGPTVVSGTGPVAASGLRTYDVRCRGYALHVYGMLENEITGNHSDTYDLIYKAATEYPDANGVVESSSSVLEQMVNQMFMDSLMGYDESMLTTNSDSEKTDLMNAGIGGFISGPYLSSNSLEVQKIVEANKPREFDKVWGGINKFLNWMGSVFAWTNGVFEAAAIFVYASLIAVNMKALVFAMAPLYIVLAGYSAKSIANVIIMMIYFIGMHYMVEIAYVMTNTINAASESFYGSTEVYLNHTGMAIKHIASMSVLFTLMFWTSVCTALGMTLGPVVDNLLSMRIAPIGRNGFEAMKSVGQLLPGGKAGSVVSAVGKTASKSMK
ncbi:hypothetical protein [Vibrio mediterranei]|uniref:hypothetical protein n=1 Tax=Vibrio mediterranei TaxID=689 RepID=UPI0040697696